MDEGELSEPGEEPKLEGGEPCEEDPGGGTTELAGDEGFFRGAPKSASFAWPAHTVREQAQMLPKQCRGLPEAFTALRHVTGSGLLEM